MSRPQHEVAEIINRFGTRFIEKHHPNTYHLRVLGALSMCRTAAPGGHKYTCDHCGSEHISYNSCRNRHCPKCQNVKQAFWVEDRINKAYPVKHYHLVFTIPEVLNRLCLFDNKWFYNHLFSCVLKDYKDDGKVKTSTLSGVEFLRRFCMHILPAGFVKIRYYGIYSSRFMSTILHNKHKMVIKPVETTTERIKRLTGVDVHICPVCKKGRLIPAAVVPRIRSPESVNITFRKQIIH